MTDADWLAAVAASPDDPLVRLVYADWLDDQGDPRGEQLRLDVTLAGMADDDPAAQPLRQRLTELVPGTDARWRAAVCRVPVSFDQAHWTESAACMCDLGSVPDAVPELFQYEFPGYHAIAREPVALAEWSAFTAAVRGCTTRSIRYHGDDPVVIRLLGNDSAYCDHLILEEEEVQVAPTRPTELLWEEDPPIPSHYAATSANEPLEWHAVIFFVMSTLSGGLMAWVLVR